MSKRDGDRDIVANGMTLAQIGAAVCNGCVDAGGLEEHATVLINNKTMAREVGDLIACPVWEVEMNRSALRAYIMDQIMGVLRGSDLWGFYSSLAYRLSECPAGISETGTRFRLRGIRTERYKDIRDVFAEADRRGFSVLTPEVFMLLKMHLGTNPLGLSTLVDSGVLRDYENRPIHQRICGFRRNELDSTPSPVHCRLDQLMVFKERVIYPKPEAKT